MSSLPLQFIIAIVAYAINERMARRIDYLTERFHQGIGSGIIEPRTIPCNDNAVRGPIGCRSRLGRLLNFYHRAAA
jgi:hypothetical protein